MDLGAMFSLLFIILPNSDEVSCFCHSICQMLPVCCDLVASSIATASPVVTLTLSLISYNVCDEMLSITSLVGNSSNNMFLLTIEK